jgi:hypothetical protein
MLPIFLLAYRASVHDATGVWKRTLTALQPTVWGTSQHGTTHIHTAHLMAQQQHLKLFLLAPEAIK